MITNCDFANYHVCGNKGLTTEQIKSTWNYKHGHMEGIILPKDIADALQQEKAP